MTILPKKHLSGSTGSSGSAGGPGGGHGRGHDHLDPEGPGDRDDVDDLQQMQEDGLDDDQVNLVAPHGGGNSVWGSVAANCNQSAPLGSTSSSWSPSGLSAQGVGLGSSVQPHSTSVSSGFAYNPELSNSCASSGSTASSVSISASSCSSALSASSATSSSTSSATKRRHNRGGQSGISSSSGATIGSAIMAGSKRHKMAGKMASKMPNVARSNAKNKSKNVTGSVCNNSLISSGNVGISNVARCSPSPPVALPGCSNPQDGDAAGGYNSEDEYSHLGIQLTEQEWEEKDRRFEKTMRKKGYIIKHMVDDGSCLFRAVADQVYGDQEMHGIVRGHCMNYIEQNGDYFSQYITEDIHAYVDRKRYHGVHGNHLEIQALSEMYNRPIHIYCYSSEPINIFQTPHKSDKVNVPIRLSYHRLVHYNSVIDPYTATIGMGLGLPGYNPGAADRNLMHQAFKASEETLVEQVMLEDKMKTTDWEATNEAIEEQVARESYLQWLRDNERRNALVKVKSSSVTTTAQTCTETSSTVTSGELRSPMRSQFETFTMAAGSASPKACCSKHLSGGCGSSAGASLSSNQTLKASTRSPKAGCSSDRDSPKPCSSRQKSPTASTTHSGTDHGLGDDFKLSETESFLKGLPPGMFGFDEWSNTDTLTQVIVASQKEYFDSLKKQQQQLKNDSDLQASASSQQPPKSPHL